MLEAAAETVREVARYMLRHLLLFPAVVIVCWSRAH